ncbi:Glycosyl transferase family group 2 [Rhodococcoides kyotonense]|uniref:Glycosyl transferase family group 2 n=1 Tax=Rhodococcoides kyotonense TaxID=398843 RepID=A0A239MPG7_9NOCA|nr:Glycosyl transferase family group 2 [Rhodococcus kyotonensis]
MFCDADDRVHVDWLRWLVDRARSADIVSCAVETETINPPAVHKWRPLYPSDKRFHARFLPFVFGAGFAVDRALYMHVGGCDETLVHGGEDVDLSWRIQLAGGTLAHEKRSVVAYRSRATLRGLWHQTRRYGVADARLFKSYRGYGMPRATWSDLFWTVVTLLVNNPLVPQSLSRIDRGRWVSLVAFLVGNWQGSVRHRVLYF